MEPTHTLHDQVRVLSMLYWLLLFSPLSPKALFIVTTFPYIVTLEDIHSEDLSCFSLLVIGSLSLSHRPLVPGIFPACAIPLSHFQKLELFVALLGSYIELPSHLSHSLFFLLCFWLFLLALENQRRSPLYTIFFTRVVEIS